MSPSGKVRIYLPCTLTQLRDLVTSGGVGPAPFTAHAVTDAVRAADPDGDDEAWEYAASTAAAQSSLGLIVEEEDSRRLVVAADAPSASPVATEEPSTVQVDDLIPFRQVAGVLIDDADASAAVAAAAHVWDQAMAGDPEAQALVERCLDHELGWYSAEEIGDLLDQ